MLKVEDRKTKEEKILQDIMDISTSWHKWEERRDGKTVVCIEYVRRFDPKEDGIVLDTGMVI